MSIDSRLRVLLIGKGGREHAIAWKLSQSPSVEHVYVVPGNGGTSTLSNASNLEISASDYPGLVSVAQKLKINLVVPGPDDIVVDGVEGYFREVGIPCFAPTKEAAQLEGSKAFAKDFMRRHNIPTAEYKIFTEYREATAYISSVSQPIVLKASGLAAGKGVMLPKNTAEALEALKVMMVDKRFGDSGSAVVIEEYLEGDEVSILTFSDGKTWKNLSPAQDHKRIFENDKGPNTGGMGVVAPTPAASPQVMDAIDKLILKPTFEGLRSEGLTFVGMLFTGLMITSSGPKVLEYNVRFGDPETQSVLPLLSTDLAQIMLSCTEGRLDQVPVAIMPNFACNVIVAAGGYPGEYAQGDVITVDELPEGVIIFHAGTKDVDGQLRTAGGRVMAIAATGSTMQDAVELAYKGVDCVKFQDMFYRRDIARRLLNRAQNG